MHTIKIELCADAKEVSLVRNYGGSEVYMGAFCPSIKEAAACGFTVSSNSRINQRMYNTVSETQYRLSATQNSRNRKMEEIKHLFCDEDGRIKRHKEYFDKNPYIKLPVYFK